MGRKSILILMVISICLGTVGCVKSQPTAEVQADTTTPVGGAVEYEDVDEDDDGDVEPEAEGTIGESGSLVTEPMPELVSAKHVRKSELNPTAKLKPAATPHPSATPNPEPAPSSKLQSLAKAPSKAKSKPKPAPRLKPEPRQEQKPRAKPPVPRILPLSVVAEVSGVDADSTLMAADTADALPMESTVSESLIQFQTTLNLRDPQAELPTNRKDLFLTWPEVFQGVRILRANYTLRVQQFPGVWRGTIRPAQAWADRDKKRYLIRFSEMYQNMEGYSESDVDPDHEQVLELELFLENGEVFPVRVQFKAIGALPVLTRNGLSIPQFTLADQTQQIARKGIVIRREQYFNPHNKALALWFKSSTHTRDQNPRPGHGLAFWHFFRFPIYKANPFGAPEEASAAVRVSIGDLIMDRVEIVHQDGNQESVDLTSNAATGIGNGTLKPLETVTVSWIAKPAPYTQYCSIPEKNTQRWEWSTRVLPQGVQDDPNLVFANRGPFDLSNPRSKVPPRPSEIQVPTLLHFSEDIEIEWTLARGGLGGSWTREVRVAYPFLPQAKAMGKSTYLRDKAGSTALQVNRVRNFRVVHSETEELGSFLFPSSLDIPMDIRAQCQGVYP